MPARFEREQDNIFTTAFSLTINQKLMKKIEKEYLTMKSKKTEDEMEIRVGEHTRHSELGLTFSMK